MMTLPKTELWAEQINELRSKTQMPERAAMPHANVRVWDLVSCPAASNVEDAKWTIPEVSDPHHHPPVRSLSRRTISDSMSNLRFRLDRANRHFRQKAAAVLRDKNAVLLLAALYKQSNMRAEEFDTCAHGISLAKLAAADFCDIGSESIYITIAGREFIESIARS